MKRKILLLAALMLVSVGCSNEKKENKYENIKVGDYIAYDAGSWSKEELEDTLVEKRGYIQGQFSLYMREEGDSKNNSIVEGCYKDDNKTDFSGWRVINIDDEKISLIHAGIPICYYHCLTNDHSHQNESLRLLNEYANEHFVNKEYAISARSAVCGDFFQGEDCVYGNKGLTKEYLRSEIFDDKTMYAIGDNYWLANASNVYRLWDWNNDYNSFSNHDTHPYGLRPVVTLKENVVLDGTGNGTKENPYGIKVN